MNFEEALKYLNIECYGDRIFHSNSHGELFHLWDYINIANTMKDLGVEDASFFGEFLAEVVSGAEKSWSRPESVFQHIPRIFSEWLKVQYETGNP